MSGPVIACVCGHALSSHRQDPVDPWRTEVCKTCGCAGFENADEAKMQNDAEDDELNIVAAYAVRAAAPSVEPDHALHFDPSCEECAYLARPVAIHVPSPDREAGLREAALIADLDTFIKYVDNPSMGHDTPAMLEEVGRVAARHAKALRAALHREDGA